MSKDWILNQVHKGRELGFEIVHLRPTSVKQPDSFSRIEIWKYDLGIAHDTVQNIQTLYKQTSLFENWDLKWWLRHCWCLNTQPSIDRPYTIRPHFWELSSEFERLIREWLRLGKTWYDTSTLGLICAKVLPEDCPLVLRLWQYLKIAKSFWAVMPSS